jgi:hypothetical protein
MGRQCYISFKTEDEYFKKYIQDELKIDMIDKSLDEPIYSEDPDYIMKKIREDYLSDSTVTIFLIGSYSAENSIFHNQSFIKRELQASLYNGQGNSRNGILGIVLPSMKNNIYRGPYNCAVCGESHNCVIVNDNTVIKEFSINYHIPHDKCHWTEDDKYCVLVSWEDFKSDPETYIEKAFKKRFDKISEKITVYPK